MATDQLQKLTRTLSRCQIIQQWNVQIQAPSAPFKFETLTYGSGLTPATILKMFDQLIKPIGF